MIKVLFKEVNLFKRKVPLLIIVWVALTLITAFAEIWKGSINNYYIFEYVFHHAVEQKPLYISYPGEYNDQNHYGPLFSLMIAPFAILPSWLGCILWALANSVVLLIAIRYLQVSKEKQLFIMAVTLIEMLTATHNLQFNTMISGWIILAFILVEKEKDFWATLLIAAGFLMKLYGIGGLLFFVFSQHKLKFALSFVFWTVILFALPMLYSSPRFIIDSYYGWFDSLKTKNEINIQGYNMASHQDISLMGIFRRILQDPSLTNMYFLVPGALLITAPLLRFKQYASENFRLSYLAIVMISVVIFSSSAESSTYVIAVPGCAIFFLLYYREYPGLAMALLIFLFLFTVLSPTDLCPPYLKLNFFRKYSLKALPCCLIWLWLIIEVSFKNFIGSKPVRT